MVLVLDLFCGKKSVKEICDKLNYDYIGLDIDKKFNPNICIDFLDWDYKSIKPNILWGSPDCSCYSLASGYTHFDINHNPKTEKCKKSLLVIEKLKECINYYLDNIPNFIYYIENPTARLSWFINEYPRYDVSYCKYGLDRMKPTTIWTNKTNFIPKKCKRSNPNCNHIKAPRGSKLGTEGLKKEDRYKIPIKLLEDLFK
jgi:hypothetical protein